MEVMIKDLMDGNPIRGIKGCSQAQTEAEVEEVLGFSISAVKLFNTN